MIYFILLIIAIILFIIVVPIAGIYTFTYYRFKESDNRKKYYYRIAYTFDVLANVIGGEFFEWILCIERTEYSLFGKPNYSLSESIGKEIVQRNFNYKHQWFLNILNKAFKQKNHCLESYIDRVEYDSIN